MKLTDFLQDVGRPIAYYPSLRKITGSTNATIFLCQLLYWKGKEADPEGWIYKTTEQWEEETGLSYEEQKTARNKLKQAELIEEHYARLDHQMKYRPNTEAIDEKWRTWQSLVREEGNPALGNEAIPHSLKGITETTSETTSQNKEIAADAARPTGTNGVVIFGEGQEYAEIEAPVFANSCAWCGGIGRHEEGCELVSKPKPPTPADVETMFNLLKEGTPSAYEEAHMPKYPKPPKKTKPRDPRLLHPGLIAYRDLAKNTPPEAIRDEMIATFGEGMTLGDGLKWREIVSQWIGRGYNPRNISGMLEVYRHGWKQNGHAPKPAQPVQYAEEH